MESNLFTDPESIAKCVEIMDSFGYQALRAEDDPWDSVDVHGREHNILDLSRSYKVVRVTSDVESSIISCVAQSADKLAVQGWTPAQRLKIDLA